MNCYYKLSHIGVVTYLYVHYRYSHACIMKSPLISFNNDLVISISSQQQEMKDASSLSNLSHDYMQTFIEDYTVP
jgi:hypothetical protein